MNRYRRLLSYPGAKSLLLLSLLTRSVNIPIGVLLTVIAFEITNSWPLAALLGGAAALSSALSFWLSGMAMDIWSPKKVLLLFLPGTLLPLLFLLQTEGALLFLLALLVGLTRPPSGTTLRTSWQRLVPKGGDRLLAYGVDASLSPIAGAMGTAGSGLLLALFGVSGVVLFLVLAAFFSTLLLAFHRTSLAPGERKKAGPKGLREEARESPFGSRIWATLSLVLLSWGGLVGLEILIGDRFGSEALLFLTSLGGIAVALGALFSHRSSDTSGRAPLITAALVASGALLLCGAGIFYFAPLLFPAIVLFGLMRGVISASASTYLSIASSEERRSEALALYGSSVLVGQALYRPLAGALLLFAPALIVIIPAASFLLARSILRRDAVSKKTNQ